MQLQVIIETILTRLLQYHVDYVVSFILEVGATVVGNSAVGIVGQVGQLHGGQTVPRT